MSTEQQRIDALERSEAVLRRLEPLCECAEIGVPQQACPIHGDGETFVACVRALEAMVSGLRQLTERVDVLERRTHSGRPLLAAELSQRRGAP